MAEMHSQCCQCCAEVDRLRAELDDLRGQNAATEQHFANYHADWIVRERDLTQRAERLRHLSTSLTEMLENTIGIHAHVRMDTDKDRELHGRAVAAMREGLAKARAELNGGAS